MKARTILGVLLVGAIAAVWFAVRSASTPAPPVDTQAALPAPTPVQDQPIQAPPTSPAPPPKAPATAAELLTEQWFALVGSARALSEEEERQAQAWEEQLLSMGEGAVTPVIARLNGSTLPAARDRLFNLLRRLPWPAVEARVIEEARQGKQSSTRAMAFESLGQQKTPTAVAALSDVALTDPDLPAAPLIAEPRNPNDPSTELPDEKVFTPRMKAMAALANTGDPKAVQVLAELARTGPHESIRLEAARNLGLLRDNPAALEALKLAAASDPAAYVRLSALHALKGANDPSLATLAGQIAASDADKGVRILAAQVAADLPK